MLIRFYDGVVRSTTLLLGQRFPVLLRFVVTFPLLRACHSRAGDYVPRHLIRLFCGGVLPILRTVITTLHLPLLPHLITRYGLRCSFPIAYHTTTSPHVPTLQPYISVVSSLLAYVTFTPTFTLFVPSIHLAFPVVVVSPHVPVCSFVDLRSPLPFDCGVE